MDFGVILDTWERKRGAAFPVCNKDTETRAGGAAAGQRRSRLLRKKPDDTIDLHGLSRGEAWTALGLFFENSRRKGFEKLQIIHGKGNHRSGTPRCSAPAEGGEEGALKELSRRFIESCPYAGESGNFPAREGGSGATWVILKGRD